MKNEFEPVVHEISTLITEWEPRLSGLPVEMITKRRNSQNRTIRQILGHLIDSASNNNHRIVHLQYRESPLQFPNYASEGNNDRWIAIQHYQEEDWHNLVQLWKYSNRHLIHVIQHINPEKLKNEWIASAGKKVSLREMVTDYLRHFRLHLDEINELMHKS
jgi:hypothetical protein